MAPALLLAAGGPAPTTRHGGDPAQQVVSFAPASPGQKIVAADGASRHELGHSVSVAGSRALVGAHGAGQDSDATGAAYVFRRGVAGGICGEGVWCEAARLVAPDASPDDRFGWSVSLAGDHALVGAWGDEGVGPDTGAAYIFRRGCGSPGWCEPAKLVASDGVANDRFGWSVSVTDNRALVGALDDTDHGPGTGSAYVFEWDESGAYCEAGGWCEVAKLTAAGGNAEDFFGSAVSLARDRAAVGAWGDDGNGSNAGAVYLFEHDATGELCGFIYWCEVARLAAGDTVAGDQFGVSVSLSGDRLLVGAQGDDERGLDAGAAYVFERDEIGGVCGRGEWCEVAKLTAPDGAPGDRLGGSVHLEGNRAVVGARWDDANGSGSGAALVFELDETGALCGAGNWCRIATLSAADGVADDFLGGAVSLSGDVVILGASGTNDLGGDSGAAYVYELPTAAASGYPVGTLTDAGIGTR